MDSVPAYTKFLKKEMDMADKLDEENEALRQEPREQRRRDAPVGANATQVGGAHYKSQVQHWDFVAANNLDYFQGQITKYVYRWKNKNGLQDLEKAMHFLQKYMELVKQGVITK